MLERLALTNFTAFTDLTLDFSPGVNLLIGANGTGKTHILELLYAALETQKSKPDGDALARKLNGVFLPRNRQLGRLVHRVKGGATCTVKIVRQGRELAFSFTNQTAEQIDFKSRWNSDIGSSVYVPVKEMLANAPGFRALYKAREIHFEEVYDDILAKAFLPLLRGPTSKERKPLLKMLQRAMAGRVIQKGEQFFLKNPQGELEFTLLAEGLRKFALLWLLIQNGTLLEGSTLFWDEPEANLNPKLMQTLVEILLHLQRQGVQIFVATHSYVILKEFDLQRATEDKLFFFSLERTGENTIGVQTGDTYLGIVPNDIAAAYESIYDQEIRRSLGGPQ